jgi:diguanylate cyclase (GGDEF)-like protein
MRFNQGNPEQVSQQINGMGDIMKIGEFADLNGVTAKLLRHYDEIGLLKPNGVDGENGYRSYEPDQAHTLNWILILKALGFALGDIRVLLQGPVDSRRFIDELLMQRKIIRDGLEEQIQKKVLIDRLILLINKEGFDVNRTIDLMRFEAQSVHDIKRNMPNMEAFLDEVRLMLVRGAETEDIGVLRIDISTFNRVNDTHGFVVGDRVILAFHDALADAISGYGANATIGRAHGDEFVAFLKADREALRTVGEKIMALLAAFDWQAIGCGWPVTGKIGIVCTSKDKAKDIRQTIDASYEALRKAEAKGPGSMVLEVL